MYLNNKDTSWTSYENKRHVNNLKHKPSRKLEREQPSELLSPAPTNIGTKNTEVVKALRLLGFNLRPTLTTIVLIKIRLLIPSVHIYIEPTALSATLGCELPLAKFQKSNQLFRIVGLNSITIPRDSILPTGWCAFIHNYDCTCPMAFCDKAL